MDHEMDRAIGAFMGLAIGDALGAPIEFTKRDSYEPVTGFRAGGPFNLEAGQWTDDTAQAYALADTFVANHGDFDAGDFLQRMSAWQTYGVYSCTKTCFDIGNQTRAALDAFRRTGETEHNTDARKLGNGSVMRGVAAPIAARTREEALDFATEQSRTTHAAPGCLAETAIFAGELYDAIEGIPYKGEDALRGTPRDQISSTGYISSTLTAARWAVTNTSSFEEAVLLAVNLGDDADTVGAVTGQLAGAIYGFTGIPRAWRDEVAWSKKLIGLAGQLYALRGR